MSLIDVRVLLLLVIPGAFAQRALAPFQDGTTTPSASSQTTGTIGASTQSSLQFAGAGYSLPLHAIAPGQVVTFFVGGANTVLAQPIQLATTPLPTRLAGFSITLSQLISGPLPDVLSQQVLPILAVQQTNGCYDFGSRPACVITGITVQIPTDLEGGGTSRHAAGKVSHWISIAENGTASDSFGVSVQLTLPHILTGLDTIAVLLNCCFPGPMITHANGTIVSISNPANAGEILTMYAVGLGRTTPLIPAGTVTPFPAPATIEEFAVKYSYAIAPTISPSLSSERLAPEPIMFSGLTPGQIGLYQVNFRVPSPPPNTRYCFDAYPGTFSDSTNLSLFLASTSAAGVSDSVGICVALPNGGVNTPSPESN